MELQRASSISTHAPLAGRDPFFNSMMDKSSGFQPTRPLRGATLMWSCAATCTRISTHAPLAGRDVNPRRGLSLGVISTHAPLAGRDFHQVLKRVTESEFQPTRPLRGATIVIHSVVSSFLFQPTRPLRGATEKSSAVLLRSPNFNPRAPCGARRAARPTVSPTCGISTHAPLAGRDLTAMYIRRREAGISTHAPLAGRDAATATG